MPGGTTAVTIGPDGKPKRVSTTQIDNSGGYVYAGGKATYLPDRNAFYDYVATTRVPDKEFYNNPFGVSAQEIQGIDRRFGPTGTGIRNAGNDGTGGPAYDPKQLAAINSQLGTIRSSAGDKINTDFRNFDRGINRSYDDFFSQQQSIDNQGIQNELAKRQATTGILGMVGRGIQSGGTMLANRNAGSSSAAGAIARAYGQLGQRELASAGQEYELGNFGIEQAQEGFNRSRKSSLEDIDEEIQNSVSGIASEAEAKLAQLDQQRLGLSLPEQFEVEQQKNRIKAEAKAKLFGLVNKAKERFGSINPLSGEDRRAKAYELATAGQAPENPFDFSTEAPLPAAASGGPNLPIYINPRRRREE